MKLVEVPHALPGSCKGCGSGSPEKGPFIDTEFHEEFHGRVYYCHECASQIAQLLGFISPEQADTLIKENVDLAQANFALKVQNENLGKAIDGLVAGGYSDSTVSASPVVDSSVSSPTLFDDVESENAGSNATGSQGTETELGDRAGTVTESEYVERMADIRSDDESDANSDDFRLSF